MIGLPENNRLEPVRIPVDFHDGKLIADYVGQSRVIELRIERRPSRKCRLDERVIVGGQHRVQTQLRQQSMSRSGSQSRVAENFLNEAVEIRLTDPRLQLMHRKKQVPVRLHN